APNEGAVLADSLYRFAWVEAPAAEATTSTPHTWVHVDPGALGSSVAGALGGDTQIRVGFGETYAEGSEQVQLRRGVSEDWARLLDRCAGEVNIVVWMDRAETPLRGPLDVWNASAQPAL